MCTRGGAGPLVGTLADMGATTGGPAAPTPAFCDRAHIPTARDLATVLGHAIGPWRSLTAELAREFPPVVETWAYSGKTLGWSLRLAHRDRPIAYLAPMAGRFRASLAIPERAMPAALEAVLPESVRAIVATAPAYPEGRAVRVLVAADEDIARVLTLARIRMAAR
jgi:hypothetical protein